MGDHGQQPARTQVEDGFENGGRDDRDRHFEQNRTTSAKRGKLSRGGGHVVRRKVDFRANEDREGNVFSAQMPLETLDQRRNS